LIRALFEQSIITNGKLSGSYFEGNRLSPDIAAQWQLRASCAEAHPGQRLHDRGEKTIAQIADRTIAANAELFA
jgi:hypothetical protein